MEGERPERDPFEGLELDDDFVDAASFQEGTARERLEAGKSRREAEIHALQWRDKRHRQRSRSEHPSAWTSTRARPNGMPAPSRASRERIPWRGIFAVVVIAGLLAWNSFGRNAGPTPGGLLGRTADAFNFEGVVTDFPSPSDERQDQPLGQPPDPPLEEGSYVFIATQPDSTRPVAYDPCRPIHVAVNDRTMPIGGDLLLEQALDDISAATGLQFVTDGTTDEEPADHRAPVDEDRYGDRWAPVLVAWSDPLVTPDLKGDTAGVGGSQGMSKGDGETVYVTGMVALDGPQFGQFMDRGDGQMIALAILRHELGHLVGLDHVDDPQELMYPQASDSVFSFGPGDLAGLSLLGQGTCRSDL